MASPFVVCAPGRPAAAPVGPWRRPARGRAAAGPRGRTRRRRPRTGRWARWTMPRLNWAAASPPAAANIACGAVEIALDGASPAPGCCGRHQPRVEREGPAARGVRPPRRSPPSATSSRGCSARTPRRGSSASARSNCARAASLRARATCRIVPSVLRTHGDAGPADAARYASPRPKCGKPQSRQIRARPSHAAPSRGSSRAARAKCSCAWSRMPART